MDRVTTFAISPTSGESISVCARRCLGMLPHGPPLPIVSSMHIGEQLIEPIAMEGVDWNQSLRGECSGKAFEVGNAGVTGGVDVVQWGFGGLQPRSNR